MTTHEKGNIGVANVIANLIEQGWQVLTPVSSVSPFDVVAYRDGEFCRIQVKYSSAKNGKVVAGCRRQTITPRQITRARNFEMDAVAIYCPDTKNCYYIRVEGHPKGCYQLQVKDAEKFNVVLSSSGLGPAPDKRETLVRIQAEQPV